MNSILKTCLVRGILGFLGLLLVIGFIQNEIHKPRPSLFGPQWSLEEFQYYFVGDLPKTATDIQYRSLTGYGLLSFKASPSDAIAFAQHFCYGSLLTGYDPFNSFDTFDNKSGDGFLIQTQSRYFYYSHSIHTVNTQLGNRCNDIKRLGLHQIVVYTQDKTQYEVKLEISSTCGSQAAPHPCDGLPVPYTNHGSMKLNTTYVVNARYAEGDTWEISLEPNKQYTLFVKPRGAQSQTRHDFQAATVPALTSESDTTYCEACWLDTRGSSQDAFEASFLSPASGLSYINLFWMSPEFTYEISVIQKK